MEKALHNTDIPRRIGTTDTFEYRGIPIIEKKKANGNLYYRIVAATYQVNCTSLIWAKRIIDANFKKYR